LPHAAATTAGDDGRRSGIKLTPSNAAPAVGESIGSTSTRITIIGFAPFRRSRSSRI